MSRTHKPAYFALTALVVVALAFACCLGGSLGAAGSLERGGVSGSSFLAPHFAPFSASGAAASSRPQVLRGGPAMALLKPALASSAGGGVASLPAMCAGVSIEPFSLRLRI